jgi:hypothetical protein
MIPRIGELTDTTTLEDMARHCNHHVDAFRMIRAGFICPTCLILWLDLDDPDLTDHFSYEP